MKRIKNIIKIFGFISLLLLALVGIGLPITFFNRDRLSGDKFYDEQVDEQGEEGDVFEVKN